MRPLIGACDLRRIYITIFQYLMPATYYIHIGLQWRWATILFYSLNAVSVGPRGNVTPWFRAVWSLDKYWTAYSAGKWQSQRTCRNRQQCHMPTYIYSLLNYWFQFKVVISQTVIIWANMTSFEFVSTQVYSSKHLPKYTYKHFAFLLSTTF